MAPHLHRGVRVDRAVDRRRAAHRGRVGGERRLRGRGHRVAIRPVAAVHRVGRVVGRAVAGRPITRSALAGVRVVADDVARRRRVGRRAIGARVRRLDGPVELTEVRDEHAPRQYNRRDARQREPAPHAPVRRGTSSRRAPGGAVLVVEGGARAGRHGYRWYRMADRRSDANASHLDTSRPRHSARREVGTSRSRCGTAARSAWSRHLHASTVPGVRHGASGRRRDDVPDVVSRGRRQGVRPSRSRSEPLGPQLNDESPRPVGVTTTSGFEGADGSLLELVTLNAPGATPASASDAVTSAT